MRLSGGYDMEPAWLSGRASVEGTIVRFIPGQNVAAAAVVKLDQPISAKGVTGNMLVLELRYAGADWVSDEIVHVELCDFEPDPIRWQDRRQGAWVESHAACRRMGST